MSTRRQRSRKAKLGTQKSTEDLAYEGYKRSPTYRLLDGFLAARDAGVAPPIPDDEIREEMRSGDAPWVDDDNTVYNSNPAMREFDDGDTTAEYWEDSYRGYSGDWDDEDDWRDTLTEVAWFNFRFDTHLTPSEYELHAHYCSGGALNTSASSPMCGACRRRRAWDGPLRERAVRSLDELDDAGDGTFDDSASDEVYDEEYEEEMGRRHFPTDRAIVRAVLAETLDGPRCVGHGRGRAVRRSRAPFVLR